MDDVQSQNSQFKKDSATRGSFEMIVLVIENADLDLFSRRNFLSLLGELLYQITDVGDLENTCRKMMMMKKVKLEQLYEEVKKGTKR